MMGILRREYVIVGIVLVLAGLAVGIATGVHWLWNDSRLERSRSLNR